MLLQKLQQFMYGRYGGDSLNLFLLVVGLIFSLSGRIFFWPLFLIADLIYFFILFRMCSRNIPARQKECAAFYKVWGPVKAWAALQKRRFQDRKVYRYFRCPNCRRVLRAPRGRGKIEVTCQGCRKVFRKKV